MELLAGRAGRGDLDDVGRCQIRAFTAVYQVDVSIDIVANWSSPLESPFDIIVIFLMVIFGRWHLRQNTIRGYRGRERSRLVSQRYLLLLVLPVGSLE